MGGWLGSGRHKFPQSLDSEDLKDETSHDARLAHFVQSSDENNAHLLDESFDPVKWKAAKIFILPDREGDATKLAKIVGIKCLREALLAKQYETAQNRVKKALEQVLMEKERLRKLVSKNFEKSANATSGDLSSSILGLLNLFSKYVTTLTREPSLIFPKDGSATENAFVTSYKKFASFESNGWTMPSIIDIVGSTQPNSQEPEFPPSAFRSEHYKDVIRSSVSGFPTTTTAFMPSTKSSRVRSSSSPSSAF